MKVPFPRFGAAALALLAAGCASPGGGLRSGLEVLATDIYHSVAWSANLPVKAVIPVAVRRVVKSWVADLEVPAEVRRRLEERIDRAEFIDSTVPFLYQLSQLYSPKEETETFEDHVRARFADLRSTPGFEHTLFHWEAAPPAEAEAAQPAAAKNRERTKAVVMAGLVMIFDALFLEPGGDPLRVHERRTQEVIGRASAVVSNVLRKIAAELPQEGRLRGDLTKLADDTENIEALTISVGDLIGDLSYGSFQRFVRLQKRQEELREWMLGELRGDDFGRLEDYLRQAATRRYAVLICVDGLQGHLVRALTAGGRDDASRRFLEQILKEARECGASPAEGQFKKPKAQGLAFLERLAQSGFHDPRYLPHFRSLLAGASNGIAVCGISTSPTISVRNIPLVLTGAPVAGEFSTGLPNFNFLDRAEDRAWYFFGNDALQLNTVTRRSGMKNLPGRFPHLLSMSFSSYYHDGAFASTDPYLTLAVGEKRRDWGESILESQLRDRVAVETRLRGLREKLLEVLRLHRETSPVRFLARGAHYRRAEQLIDEIAELEDQGMPRYLQYYNAWPDHFAHPHGPFGDEILSVTGELNRVDFWLGRIDQLYREAGIHGRTLFALGGDHGLSPVGRLLSVDEAVFASLEKDGVRLRIRKLSADEGEPPVVTHPWHPPSMRGYDVVISSTAGGNCTLDFFLDQKSGWTRQPVASELKALRTLDGKTVDIVEETRRRLGDALDYLVVRDGPCGLAGGAVRLVATRGGKRVEALVMRRGDRIHFDFAADILEVGSLSPLVPEPEGPRGVRRQELLDRARSARPGDPATWLTELEWRELCSFSPRPDAVGQIARLYDTDLAGTVNLFPAQGVAFNSRVPGRHAGESFHEKDAFVGFWGGAVRRRSPLRTAVNGSLAPTVYEFLTGEKTTPGKDGWGFPAVRLDE